MIKIETRLHNYSHIAILFPQYEIIFYEYKQTNTKLKICLCTVAEGGRGGDPHEEWRDPCLKGLHQAGQSGEGAAETGSVSPGEGKVSSPE